MTKLLNAQITRSKQSLYEVTENTWSIKLSAVILITLDTRSFELRLISFFNIILIFRLSLRVRVRVGTIQGLRSVCLQIFQLPLFVMIGGTPADCNCHSFFRHQRQKSVYDKPQLGLEKPVESFTVKKQCSKTGMLRRKNLDLVDANTDYIEIRIVVTIFILLRIELLDQGLTFKYGPNMAQ